MNLPASDDTPASAAPSVAPGAAPAPEAAASVPPAVSAEAAPFEADPAAAADGAAAPETAPADGRGARGNRRRRGKRAGDGAPAAAEARPDARPKADAARKPARQRPAPPAILDKLAALYPQLFGARFLPLKLGAFEEFQQRHPGEFDKEELKAGLSYHARSTRYLEAVAGIGKRHDLDGNPVEDVAPEHLHHAIMEVFRRRQLRSKEDLRPWLIDRLVQAITASGLPRDAYLERIRTGDEAALQALDEAFAVLAERTARHEAVARAYRASGKTVAEFADMYGMDPDLVQQAIEAVPAG